MKGLQDYKIMSKLGQGAFSDVWKAVNNHTGQVVALKRFRKKFTSASHLKRNREIRILNALSHHENIVEFHEHIYIEDRQTLLLSLELMDINLLDIISPALSPPICEQHSKYITWQTLKALSFIHDKKIVHRDVKPENILIKGNDLHHFFNSGNDVDVTSFPRVKLADFGSSRLFSMEKAPFTDYIGTRWYRSPECLLFDGLYTEKMDIWSVGCVLFELLTKQPLFPGKDNIDQLHKINNVLGSPDKSKFFSIVSNMKLFNIVDNQTRKEIESIYDESGLSFCYQAGTGIKNSFMMNSIAIGDDKIYDRDISIDCFEFIEKLLDYDAGLRISATDALNHAWFHECSKKPAKSTSVTDSTSSDVKKYRISNEHRRHVTTIVSTITNNLLDLPDLGGQYSEFLGNLVDHTTKDQSFISYEHRRFKSMPVGMARS